MIDFKLEDLVKPATPETAQEALYGYLEVVKAPVSDWKKGGVVGTIIYVFCILYSFCTYLIAKIASMGFLQLAEGPWLTICALYGFNVERLGATFATGSLTLVNAAAVPYTVAIGDLTASAASGPEYINTEAFTLPAHGTVTIQVQARTAGSSSNVAALAVNKLVTSLSGVTVSNPQPLVGLDEEKDEALRTRCIASGAALSPMGPKAAYEYAAKTAIRLDGSSLGINKVASNNNGAGRLDVYLATASGGVSNVEVGDIPSDLTIATDTIDRKATPQCVTLFVHSADVIPLTVQYIVSLYSSVNKSEADIKSAISASLATRINLLPIGGDGGKLYLDSIKAAIIEAHPNHTYRVLLTTPGGDLTVAPNEVVQFTGAIGTVIQTPPPGGV